jgi:DNA-binding MarR family transcriptional regulator
LALRYRAIRFLEKYPLSILLRQLVAPLYTYHMQQMPAATNPGDEATETTPDELATLALETIPSVMRAIRTMMRAEGEKDLTVPQFRALGYIDRHRGASLKDVADHLGIPMSGASRLIDKLVDRQLVTRTSDTEDRRRVILNLLPTGKRLRTRARQRTQQGLDIMFQRLTPAEREAVARALPVLRDLFSSVTSFSRETRAATGKPPPS